MNYKELEKSMQQKLHDQEINIDTNQFVSDFFGKKKEVARSLFGFWQVLLFC